MEILVAIIVGFSQFACTAAVFVSLVAPERAPETVTKIPLIWRLTGLLCVSILAGIVIQLAGVSHRLN